MRIPSARCLHEVAALAWVHRSPQEDASQGLVLVAIEPGSLFEVAEHRTVVRIHALERRIEVLGTHADQRLDQVGWGGAPKAATVTASGELPCP